MTSNAGKIVAVSAGTLALLLVPAAQGKLLFADRVATESSTIAEGAVLYAGPIGAMLERDYFNTPRTVSNGNSLCRLHLYFSSEPFRLARSCD